MWTEESAGLTTGNLFDSLKRRWRRRRQTLMAWESSPHFPIRVLARGLKLLAAFKHFLFSAEYRALCWLEWTTPRLHQLSNKTKLDRYPEIFAAVASSMGAEGSLKILSFGCSTGEEVATLGNYFPRAQIVGVDINPGNVKSAARLFGNSRFEFLLSESQSTAARSPFDVIFCMAVLQRTQMKYVAIGSSGSKIYSFEQFSQQIDEFDRWLAPGGLLVLYNCNYRFCDCALAERYEVLPTPRGLDLGRPKFDRAGFRFAVNDYEEIVFRKR